MSTTYAWLKSHSIIFLSIIGIMIQWIIMVYLIQWSIILLKWQINNLAMFKVLMSSLLRFLSFLLNSWLLCFEESCEGLHVLKVIAKYFGCAFSAYVFSLGFLLYHFYPYWVIDVVRVFNFFLLESSIVLCRVLNTLVVLGILMLKFFRFVCISLMSL
jgi:hypothetical protein